MDNQPEAPTKPTAWLVHAQYPFVTMDPPIEGGLPRTELFTREQIATELRRLHAENERLRIEAQNSKEAWDALTDHAEKVYAENERLRTAAALVRAQALEEAAAELDHDWPADTIEERTMRKQYAKLIRALKASPEDSRN